MKRNFPIPQELFREILGKLDNRRAEAAIRKLPADALFYKMWNSCTDIAEQVLQTDYFKGINRGNLDPVAFGTLMVQDAYYCFRGRDGYSAAAAHAIDPAAQGFMEEKCRSYDEYNEYYHDTWHIRETSSVIPGKNIREYADYEAYIAGNLESPYLFCVMLPCEYLWTWIANRLAPSTPADSLYHFWIESNEGEPTGAIQMATMLENYRSQIDEAKAMEIFRKAMQFELAVFTAATANLSARNFKNNNHNLNNNSYDIKNV